MTHPAIFIIQPKVWTVLKRTGHEPAHLVLIQIDITITAVIFLIVNVVYTAVTVGPSAAHLLPLPFCLPVFAARGTAPAAATAAADPFSFPESSNQFSHNQGGI